MTSKIKAQNLVVYNVPLDNEGKEFKKLHINTTLLTSIRLTYGSRWNKSDTISRRLRKVWDEKHPILSKVYVPCSLWERDFGYYDRWKKPRIVIEYLDEDIVSVTFKNNQLAKQAHDLMIRHFWGDNNAKANT